MKKRKSVESKNTVLRNGYLNSGKVFRIHWTAIDYAVFQFPKKCDCRFMPYSMHYVLYRVADDVSKVMIPHMTLGVRSTLSRL